MVLLAVELPPASAGPEEVRRVVAEVLARPEYAEASPSVAARIRGWLSEQLGRLLETLFGTGEASLVGSLLLVAAVVLAAALAVRFTRALRRDPELAPATVDGVGRDPADWFAEAEAHERGGRRREALRCHYRGLVALLAAAGVVDEAPGRTAGEYLAEVRARRPDAAGDVAVVTARFESAWYGSAPVEGAALDEVRARTAAARDAVASDRPAPALSGQGS